MKNKILSLVFSFALVFSVASFTGLQVAHAQVATFPAGCTSGLGYSITNGSPCTGTGVVINSIGGCANAIGYSVTTGVPCSGTSVALQYLAGCSSVYGYSTIGGVPCNGTTFATTFPIPVATPGLPTTGAGGNASSNILLLLVSGAASLAGLGYLAKKYSYKKV